MTTRAEILLAQITATEATLASLQDEYNQITEADAKMQLQLDCYRNAYKMVQKYNKNGVDVMQAIPITFPMYLQQDLYYTTGGKIYKSLKGAFAKRDNYLNYVEEYIEENDLEEGSESEA